MKDLDITFNFYSDTPFGKDPDSYSPTLRKYHQILWSKKLPNGHNLCLTNNKPKILHHKSALGEFFLSSDSIAHTYCKHKSLIHITKNISPEEINSFFSLCSTIGAYIVFPSNRVGGKMTINGYRGLNQFIKDRFDLTLECIKLFYKNEKNPMGEVFKRYEKFFLLFENFKGYVEFFLLQDLVTSDYSSIKYFLPFEEFRKNPLPASIEEYTQYKKNLISFVNSRNNRILENINYKNNQ